MQVRLFYRRLPKCQNSLTVGADSCYNLARWQTLLILAVPKPSCERN